MLTIAVYLSLRLLFLPALPARALRSIGATEGLHVPQRRVPPRKRPRAPVAPVRRLDMLRRDVDPNVLERHRAPDALRPRLE